ncbi:hypothetical protein QQ054_10355 [Oscillatoria amoena NRMC-F 0135]|nr:hypothetical protein [Oscillatoria amoena NRMC-F 0135]
MMEKINKIVQNLVMPVLLVFTTVIGIFTNSKATQLDVKSKELKAQLDSISIVERVKQLDRSDIEFVRELKFKLFGEVKEAVKSKDEAYQQTVYEFVVQMLKDDEDFRNALLKTLANSLNKGELKEEIDRNLTTATVFAEEEAEKQLVLKMAPRAAAKVRVDVFYLEETQEKSKDVAKSVQKKLGNQYMVKLRVLPKLKNSQSGYQVYQNEIRFEEAESSIAREISSLLKTSLQEPLNERKKVSNRTDNYISIFIRNP